jgi:hypothetical protein
MQNDKNFIGGNRRRQNDNKMGSVAKNLAILQNQ